MWFKNKTNDRVDKFLRSKQPKVEYVDSKGVIFKYGLRIEILEERKDTLGESVYLTVIEMSHTRGVEKVYGVLSDPHNITNGSFFITRTCSTEWFLYLTSVLEDEDKVTGVNPRSLDEMIAFLER